MDPKVAATLHQRFEEVAHHPRSGPAWGWLGALLWAYDFRPAARHCLLEAERLEPRNPRWPYYRALGLSIATPNEAIPPLQKVVLLCGSTPEAPRFKLAQLLAEQGRWPEARAQFEPLLVDHPEFAPARLLAARDAQQRGDLPRALDLARACTDDPRTTRAAWVLLSGLHRQNSDVAASAQAAARAAALPEDQGIADPFQSEVALLRTDARILSEQAHALLAGGHLAAAQPLIDRLRNEHPSIAETWLLSGRLELLRKNLPVAEESLQRHLQMNPRSVQGHFQLGLVLLARERFADAAAAFQAATALKADFGPAYFNRGLALGRAGQSREAMGAFRESLRHNPERLESYLFLADLHLRAGERNEALAVLHQAEAIAPDDRRLVALRARAAAGQ